MWVYQCVCVLWGIIWQCVGAEEWREECSWSSMLLVLIGPYFNHSHWSVSSLTEQILSPSLSPLPNIAPSLSLSFPSPLPLCPAALVHPLTHALSLNTHTHTLPHSVCLTKSRLDFLVFYSFIHPLIHSFIHSVSLPPHSAACHCNRLSCPLSFPSVFLYRSPFFPFTHVFVLRFFHSLLPPLPPSLTSSLPFLSVPIALFLFDPCRVEEPPGRRAALVPIVHSVQSDRQEAQRAAVGRTVLCVFLLHGCKQQ